MIETEGGHHGAAPGLSRVLRPAAKVLPEHARAHNRSLVLQTLFQDGAMSRADLARETGLTRVTISDLVGGLISDGLVIELGVREDSRPGKPAILVDLDRDGHCTIGIDISGADRFVGAVLSLGGEVLSRHDVAVPGGNADYVAAVAELAAELVAAATVPILGVGVGTPGIVDDRGVVLTAPNFGWIDLDLQGVLSDVLAVPVVVVNDANAAVLAEYTFGDGSDDLMLVRVGRGVGAALLVGGQPMLGSRFAAGEIGHVMVGTDGGPPCRCGKVGCLEAWLSVPALTARLSAAAPAAADRASAAAEAGATEPDAADPGTAEPDAAVAGTADPGAAAREAVLRDAGERLGIALAPVVGALDLPEIVLSGPEELLDGPLADAAVETLRARTLAAFHDGVRVRMTQQAEDIILRGAAVMVMSRQLGVS